MAARNFSVTEIDMTKISAKAQSVPVYLHKQDFKRDTVLGVTFAVRAKTRPHYWDSLFTWVYANLTIFLPKIVAKLKRQRDKGANE